MGARTSQIAHDDTPDYLKEAKTLGNPENPRMFWKSKRKHSHYESGETVILAFSTTKSRPAAPFTGQTVFGYRLDRSRFDSGNIVVVKYDRNENIRTRENRILFRDYSSDAHMSLNFFTASVMPSISPLQDYITHVRFATTDGQHSFTVEKSYSLINLPFIELPTTLSFIAPCIKISELAVREDAQSVHSLLNIVTFEQKLYVFRHTGFYPQMEVIDWRQKELLEEMRCLIDHTSTFIMPISHLVIDDQPAKRFRGYLQEYLPAGSLADLIDVLLANPVPPPVTPFVHTPLPFDADVPRPLQISWKVKHLWCIEMASALFSLHDSKSYIGSITPRDFLVDQAGHIRLINITPGKALPGVYTAPEVIEKSRYYLEPTAACDIWSLGLIFWVLAEEEMLSERMGLVWRLPEMPWRPREMAAPWWFMKLVVKCTLENPEDRCSLKEVLDTLCASFGLDIEF